MATKKERKEFLFEKLELMKTSQHPFLVLEGKTDSSSLKKIEKLKNTCAIKTPNHP